MSTTTTSVIIGPVFVMQEYNVSGYKRIDVIKKDSTTHILDNPSLFWSISTSGSQDSSLLLSISTSGTNNTRICFVSCQHRWRAHHRRCLVVCQRRWCVHRHCCLRFQRRWLEHPSLLVNKAIKTGFHKDRRWSILPAHKIWVIPFKFQKQSYIYIQQTYINTFKG